MNKITSIGLSPSNFAKVRQSALLPEKHPIEPLSFSGNRQQALYAEGAERTWIGAGQFEGPVAMYLPLGDQAITAIDMVLSG